MDVRATIIAGFALAVSAGAAQASEACRAPAPAIGTEVHGPVLHVLDGNHLCVALGATPDTWLEIELPDAGLVHAASNPSDDSRGALMSVAFAQNVTCRIVDRATNGAVAACSLDGQPLGDLALRPQAISTGRAWR
jgi:micrococcal nuclease